MQSTEKLTSLLTPILLLLQVILSGIIIQRLNNASQVALAAANQDNGPTYIENVSVDDDPYLGPPDAAVTIVEFSDFQCPYCAEATDVIQAILNDYEGEVKYVIRDFPLDFHPQAAKAAEAANCAGDQENYWEMHDLLFANQDRLQVEHLKEYAQELQLDTRLFDECLESNKYADEIAKDIEDGRKYFVSGTPTLFVNGHRFVGAADAQLRSAIESQLQEGS